MRKISIACLSLLTMGTAANATTLAAGGLYGGTTQVFALCYLYNAGTSSVNISGKHIIEEGVGPISFSADNCGTLALGSICRFDAGIANNAVHACKAEVSPNDAHVRGILEIRDGSGTPLQTEQLR